MVAMQFVTRSVPSFGPALGLVVLVGAALLSLPITSLAARPLAPIFTHKTAPSRKDLVGKTCTVRTGVVNRRFGEALLEDGGAGLVIRVRSDGRELRRGEQALVVDWEEEREAFVDRADAGNLGGTERAFELRRGDRRLLNRQENAGASAERSAPLRKLDSDRGAIFTGS